MTFKGVYYMALCKHHEEILEKILENLYMFENRNVASEIQLVCSVQNTSFENMSLNTQEQSSNNTVTINKYEDRYIICRDCGKEFLFPAHSQKYYESNNWREPKRCKCCRDFRDVRYSMCASF